ncbi:unnamed protein product [Adineta steineri]|uniref:PX domain-containing protein n=3 Tax=Adineta steineri TaxID=433720 RepID=A0A813MUT9_9BILA|nr:unnamed protein product [Adineta steineri]
MNRSLLSLTRGSSSLNLIPYRTRMYTWLQYKEHKNFVPQLNANDIGEHQGSPHVQERFFRLGWGGYIHPQKQRRLFTYKKPDEQNQREDMHVMAANRRCKILEKMCDHKYNKRLYLVDPKYKIYDPYQRRWNMNHIPDEEHISLFEKQTAMLNESSNVEEGTTKHRADTVDLNDNDLQIDISDALSEKDKVKFTVHTKTKLTTFQESEFNVSRQHEEFIWLHDRYNENEEYAGLIIPPAPPRPDFDSSRAKLQRLSDSESTLTKEEYDKTKQELEAEYLAMFKKTVSMHEVFLQRLAAHPVLRNDNNFRVFLEYKEELSVRGKNASEKISGFFKTLTKTADEVLLANQKESDEYFERQKQFLLTYNAKIKDATNAADKSTRAHKTVADTYIKISSGFNALSTTDKTDLAQYLLLLDISLFEKQTAMLNESSNVEEGTTKHRADTVDLNDNDLQIDISDALSEKDKVKFTVHTKTKLTTFQESEFNVSRQHEEFIWLHDRYNENEEYAGLIIPPAPPRPDFDSSRAKLQRLSDSESTLTKEEYDKTKQELEAEYLAMFKKTVSMHEVFLQRLAAHPVLRNDNNFRVFLEYKEELSVRGKNASEKISGFFKTLTKTADEVLLANQKESDEYFERQKQFLLTYNAKIKDATNAADKSTRAHKTVADTYIKISSGFNALSTTDKTDLAQYLLLLAVADTYIKISSGFNALSTTDKTDLAQYLLLLGDFFEKARKLESRVQSDMDLKLSDTLRYYMRDSKAALDLMYRRSRCLADFDTANKNLDKARLKNKEVQAAETAQQNIKKKFETISEKAKDELNDFKTRRVQMFRKNLIELTELQIKHSKAQIQMIKGVLQQSETLS